MSSGSPSIRLALIATLVAPGVLLASEAPPAPPTTTSPASGSWPQLFSELASPDLQTRDTARIALMGLTRDDLPALRELVIKSRPILPAQAAALHEIVQEIYLGGEKYQTRPELDPEFRRRLLQVGATPKQSQQILDQIESAADGDKSAKLAIEKAAGQLAAQMNQPGQSDQQQRQNAQEVQQVLQQMLQQANALASAPQLGFLGIMMDELPTRADTVPENDLHRPIGVIVADRIPGFCAARNLISGDIILGVAAPFMPFRSMEDLRFAVGGSPPGTVVRLLVLRRGQVIGVTLTLDAKPVDSLLLDAGVAFRAERQKKFDAYWQSTFKPLLLQQLG